jgi:hypothetical protein
MLMMRSQRISGASRRVGSLPGNESLLRSSGPRSDHRGSARHDPCRGGNGRQAPASRTSDGSVTTAQALRGGQGSLRRSPNRVSMHTCRRANPDAHLVARSIRSNIVAVGKLSYRQPRQLTISRASRSSSVSRRTITLATPSRTAITGGRGV